MSNLLVVVSEDGGCQFKAMVAAPSDDSWFHMMAEYPSLDHAKMTLLLMSGNQPDLTLKCLKSLC
ncbi:hypothetical protein H4J46_01105 [Colwellia sp. MB02u-6]|uniref:hypothetical protein n=1 Tax=Colwellia sp. MB02u-6 TaxID=2759824 RepID=UPI0015F4F319|nr:hypothetical protein [Colwellia sp. MB02u-6]MBA6326562.1 hypothetical protein [Colwellia sp. MB02u-6]